MLAKSRVAGIGNVDGLLRPRTSVARLLVGPDTSIIRIIVTTGCAPSDGMRVGTHDSYTNCHPLTLLGDVDSECGGWESGEDQGYLEIGSASCCRFRTSAAEKQRAGSRRTPPTGARSSMRIPVGLSTMRNRCRGDRTGETELGALGFGPFSIRKDHAGRPLQVASSSIHRPGWDAAFQGPVGSGGSPRTRGGPHRRPQSAATRARPTPTHTRSRRRGHPALSVNRPSKVNPE